LRPQVKNPEFFPDSDHEGVRDHEEIIMVEAMIVEVIVKREKSRLVKNQFV
jgi:hypothetical protein